MMAHYKPPTQGKASQLFDVVVLVVLTVGSLFVPLWLNMAGAAKSVAEPIANPTWEALGQNAAQAAKYEALGFTPETAHDLILARFDYSFSTTALLTMIVVIFLYYFLSCGFPKRNTARSFPKNSASEAPRWSSGTISNTAPGVFRPFWACTC